MKRKRTLSQDDPEQSKRFIDMARELGAGESREAFEKAFDNVVKPSVSSKKRKRTPTQLVSEQKNS